MSGVRYSPASVVVAPGDTIEWRNEDIVPHTVTAADSTWDSGTVAIGEAWRWVATGKGAVAYACRFHPLMKGSLTVR